MRPKERSLYNQYNATLRSRSGKLYLKALNKLCEAHDLKTSWPDLYTALRRGDMTSAFSISTAGIHTVVESPNDVWNYFKHQQFVYLIKKYPFSSCGVDSVKNLNPKEKAISKFLEAERNCRNMNYLVNELSEPGQYSYLFARMRAYIKYVLGDLDSSVFDNCDFGPGASLGVNGRSSNLGRKLSSPARTVTLKALHYMPIALEKNFHLLEAFAEEEGSPIVCVDYTQYLSPRQPRYSVVRHNKISFVPKTADCSRTIGVEPLLNGFLQKGVDTTIRRRLKRIGIDLSDQSRNQEFARQGSLDDSPEGFVTIDLKSASDSLSCGLVANLLPDTWYRLLDDLRSPAYELDGALHEYHKFVSMGNGYCFPLQSLIFTAACIACDAGTAGKDFTVYGDDIIVRKKYARAVIHLLGCMGFETNSSKTFLDGPFRESCGEDWLFGVNVRHFTLDFRLDSIVNLVKFLNLSRRNTLCEEFFRPVRDLVFSQIPEPFRFVRPVIGNDDGAITVELDAFMTSPHARWSRVLQTWTWKEFSAVPERDIGMELRSRVSFHTMPYVMLRGADSRYPYTLRSSRASTKTVRKYGMASSNWVPSPL